jgi:DNA-binding response OmpR family regulator
MRVLIIDDDRILADILAFALLREGFHVVQAHDGESALEIWAKFKPDLIILDINLPGTDGFTICEQIRRKADTPIIMLTVRSKDEDIVRGFELGADDYILKPFSPRQLVARAHAILRRAVKFASGGSRQVGNLRVERSEPLVWNTQGEPISLTTLEGRLVDFLILNAGQELPFDLIIDHVWGSNGGNKDKLRQLVHRLRRKIEADPSNPLLIKTVPGLGYKWIGNDQVDGESPAL